MNDTSSVWLLLYYLFIAFEVCIGAESLYTHLWWDHSISQRERRDLINWLILEGGSAKLVYGNDV